jgi:hypothetical protein
MDPRPIRTFAIAASLLVAGTACASRVGTGSGSISHPTGANDLVLRVDVGGGFVAPAATLRQVPSFTLLGDGRVVIPGPQIDIYPGPALPNLQAQTITEEGVQQILRAASAAGLLGPDHRYLTPIAIADAPTTTFTLVAEGRRHVISVYALGQTGPGSTASAEARARAALASFQSKLGDLALWLPKGSIGPSQPFAFDRLRVFVTRATEPGPTAGVPLTEPALTWPVASPLSTFGAQLKDPLAAYRCGVVQGSDLTILMPLIRRANELTPWRSDGRSYQLVLRPLLPGEPDCPA